jgi:hypothetical protein
MTDLEQLLPHLKPPVDRTFLIELLHEAKVPTIIKPMIYSFLQMAEQSELDQIGQFILIVMDQPEEERKGFITKALSSQEIPESMRRLAGVYYPGKK